MPRDDLTVPIAFDGMRTRSTWDASLSLQFAHRGTGTVLARRRHSGPLLIQKPLYPEGADVCHTTIIHPPGGIAGGDRLEIRLDLGVGAHALVTTPSATRWYKSSGAAAHQQVTITANADAVIEFMPQENILYDAADVLLSTCVDLDSTSVYAGWDIVSFGRRESGEIFRRGQLDQSLRIRRNGHPIWIEHALFAAGGRSMVSPVGLGGAPVYAGMIVAAGVTPQEALAACRAVTPRAGRRWGVTALPEVLAARFLGDHVEDARGWLDGLWRVLRPYYANRPACRPRLWDT